MANLRDAGDPKIPYAALGPPHLHRMHPGALGKSLLRQTLALAVRSDIGANDVLDLHRGIIESRAKGVQSR